MSLPAPEENPHRDVCGHRAAGLVQARVLPLHFWVCRSCRGRLARWLLSASTSQRSGVWDLRAAARTLAAAPSVLDAGEYQRITAAFSATAVQAVGAMPAVNQAEVRALLAQAYREMQMMEDALVEAATALTLHPTHEVEGSAATVLLDHRLLRANAAESIRAVLFPA